ncbi:peptidase domain-containing ABC transporter [Roseibium sp.]|uniref:peptidase domain-containing ABC transporter n=1 Tax=Roseibium sp. TaxID=1936156 RepID=UPI003A9781CE
MAIAENLSTTGFASPAGNQGQKTTDLQRRLHIQSGGNRKNASPAENCLIPLLKALAWDGLERHLFEALPHLEGIGGIYELRAVLTRLNYRTTQSAKKLKDLTAENFPCILSLADDVYVCLGRTQTGKILAYSGSRKEEVSLPQTAQRDGDLFLINQEEGGIGARSAEFMHWSSRLMHQFRGTLTSILVVGLLSNLMALGLPLFVMNIYDKAIAAKSPNVLVTLLIGVSVILALDLLVKTTKARLQAYFGTRLDSVVANATFRHFLHLPLAMTISAPIGAQITRLRQFEGVRDIFHGNLANALIDLPFSAIFIVALGILGGQLALLPAALMLVYTIAAFTMVPRMKRAINVTGEAKSRLQNITVETLGKHTAIRDLSADSIWLEKYRTISSDFALKNLKTRQLSMIMQVVSQMMMTVCGIAVLGLGAIQVMNKDLSQGALIAVMALSWRSLNPMHQAFLSLTQLGQAQQTIERINSLLKIDLERQPGAVPSLHRALKGNLTLSSLVMRYPGRQEPALRNLNLRVEKGEVLTITGPSGSGKTTVMRTILGLYRPQMGAILADDLDIRQLDPGEWRNTIGYAPEHYDFFYGTIAQNMQIADPQADMARLRQTFEDFGLDQYKDLLPEGLETRLSGTLLERIPDNVKQRILLARAFTRDAPIYLLDNPAGNLDFEGDKLLMKKIDEVRGRSTVIMTTYRPSHMRMADRLAYLQQGQVTIYGPPEEVLDEVMKQ